MNPGWDAAPPRDRINVLGLDPRQRAGKLSGGQRAQLALTLALAKRPELLILDEPIASLDPLARSEFLRSLAEYTASRQVSVVMASHLVSDLERICDYLIVLVASRVQVAGPVTDLLAPHGQGLEDLVLDYMSQGGPIGHPARPPAHPGGMTMIWLTWRQFRAQAIAAVVAPGRARRPAGRYRPVHGSPLRQQRHRHLHRSQLRAAHQHLRQQAAWFDTVIYLPRPRNHVPRAGHRRSVLGNAADLSRDRGPDPPAELEPERDENPVAGRQARPGRPGQRGHGRAFQPHADLVVQPDGQHARDPVRSPAPPRAARAGAIRHARRRTARLRCLRLRSRRHGRDADPPRRVRDGRHPGCLRRPPVRLGRMDPRPPRPARHHHRATESPAPSPC